MNWDTAVDGYWLARRRDMSAHTGQGLYTHIFRRFPEFVGGGRQVKAIKRRDIDAFLNHLSDDLNLAPKTVATPGLPPASGHGRSKSLACRRSCMACAGHNQRRLVQPYSQEEVQRLLDACKHHAPGTTATINDHVPGQRPTAARDQAMILLLLDTGIRAAELAALRLRDYDRKAGQLTVLHGKGGKQRALYLGQAAQRALWRYLFARDTGDLSAPLLATVDGGPLDRVVLGRHLHRIGVRAGVPDVGPHRFRHTFAINFLRNGGHLLALQDILGHSTLAMVRRYARLAEVDIAEAQRSASPATAGDCRWSRRAHHHRITNVPVVAAEFVQLDVRRMQQAGVAGGGVGAVGAVPESADKSRMLDGPS